MAASERCVSARKRADLAWIDAFGYAPLHTNRLSGTLGEFRVVFNTVPHQVLDEALLAELPPDCLLIELASASGFDMDAVETLRLSYLKAGGLPGRVAPETAARAIMLLPQLVGQVGKPGTNSGMRDQKDVMSTHQGGSMKIGFAFCGSFCNHPELLKLYEDIAREHEIVPILSENAAKYSTRFGTAEDFVTRVEVLAGRKAVRNIVEAEPLGPQGAMEVLVIAPCTGNTLAKLAHGITDGAVTMAAKGHLRNGKPVVLAIATNDGLSASAPNIAVLLNRKNYYFVPFGQDNAEAKPTSLIADFRKIIPTAEAALEGRQIQPILL